MLNGEPQRTDLVAGTATDTSVNGREKLFDRGFGWGDGLPIVHLLLKRKSGESGGDGNRRDGVKSFLSRHLRFLVGEVKSACSIF